ncbi:hypothetical protein K8R03_02840 [Candidatus Kaiserbacteria bacterium]|nr:hypothetical protein [Candidatus Kaiserbacteria bacterium]
MSRVRIVVSALALIVILAASAAILLSARGEKAGTDSGAFSDERAHMESLFAGRSAAEAFGMFKNENAKLSAVDQHTSAHIFGEVLYEHEGIKGFTVCDGSFGFGCYHSFLGRAIAEHGPDVVKVLDATCVTIYGPDGTGCFHGIGHGLLSYYGYGIQDVEKSLSLCATLSWKKPIGGCADGVFMEYNFRVMEKDATKRYRPFDAGNVYEPCPSLSLYPEACYFGLPAWWATALPFDSALPQKLGGFCAAVAESRLRVACYRGLGYGIIPETHFNADAGEVFCDNAATGNARLWCREGLAWAFYADPVTRDKAEGVCTKGLNASESSTCLKEYFFAIQ